MVSFEDVRSNLFKILGQTSFGEDVVEVRFTGFHYARGVESIDEAVPGLMEMDNEILSVIYKQGETLSRRDKEMAFHFFKTASDAVKNFSLEDLNKWVDMGLEVADNYGIIPARNFFKGITRETIDKIHSHGLEYESVSRILETYIIALSGDTIKIQPESISYTDTRTLFLPFEISNFNDNDLNFKFYKVIAAHKYGQMRYRSLDLKLSRMKDLVEDMESRYSRATSYEREGLENFINLFPESRLALDIFNIIENARVERNLRKEFRGLARDMDIILKEEWEMRASIDKLPDKEAVVEAFNQLLTFGKVKGEIKEYLKPVVDKSYDIAKNTLENRKSHVEDSARATAEIYEVIEEKFFGIPYIGIDILKYRGVIKPEQVTRAIKQTKKEIAENIKKLIKDLKLEKPPDIDSELQHNMNEVLDPLSYGAPLDFLFKMGIEVPEELEDELLKEIEKKLGELGEIDASMLMKVLDNAGKKLRANLQAKITEFQVELTDEDIAGAILYDEWDYEIASYRASWCALKEKTMRKGSDKFVEKTIEKNSSLVNMIKKQFEMLRPEYKRLFRQTYGEEIDLDAFIEAYADMKAGVTPSEKLYMRIDKKDRDIAVAFLVDLSGSTTGWVIETEKEALVLMCEALEILDDKYAIFGFTGKTRKKCDFYIIKRFKDDYNEEVKKRIAGMDAFDYTRMGPPIRHLTKILEDTPAKIKLLIVLSDGKPEDFDEYKGEHGIEDTKKALMEAKRKHIRPFCITIDNTARDYLQRMFGDIGYIIIDDVSKLPRKLPEIYRKLTT
ncbi:von Willebrand factor type A domain protein [archaeon]|nr:von Willebrand factor type A domain protein [archaeon]